MSLVKAKVNGVSAAYFTSEPVLDAEGNPRKRSNGDKITVQVRHEARRGEVIQLSEYEFDRLAAEDIVVAEDEELRPLGQSLPTPFSVPVVVDGKPRMFDPGDIAEAAGELAPDLAAQLEARADGTAGPEGEFVIDDADEEALKKWVDSNNIETIQTYLKNENDGEMPDPDDARRVIEAELTRDNPRQSLVDNLEKVASPA